MSDIGLRPTFIDSLPMKPEKVRELLTTRIREQGADCDCQSFSVYLAGRIGRTLGEAQTKQLRSIYQSATGHVVEVH